MKEWHDSGLTSTNELKRKAQHVATQLDTHTKQYIFQNSACPPPPLQWDAMHSHDNDGGGIVQRRLLNQSATMDFPCATLRVTDRENPPLHSCHRFLTALLKSGRNMM